MIAKTVSNSYSIQEGEFLARLARRAIETYLQSRRVISAPAETPPKLMQKSGVFVTLNSITRKPALRACVGYPQPIKPLALATIKAGIQSATQDPRFPPVRLEEFQNDIAVELSVLTPPELISVKSALDYAGEIAVGKHGLIVELNGHAGILLPQVAGEWKWDPEEFLSQICLKADLPPDAWLLNGTRIKRFEAVIFAETKPGGPVVLREEG